MSVVYFIVALLLWTGCAERIVSPPEDVIAFVGDDVELKCLVEFSGTNTLTWEFNDVAVYYYQFGKEEYPNVGDMMHGFLVKQDGSNFNVALTDVSYATAGKYTCRLTAAVAAVHVIVLDRPQLHSSVPKPEEGNIAVYTCELHFGGPKKSDVSPDLYPQLRILFDNKLVDGTSHMQEPTSNSTKYHVLKLIYHTVLASSMDGKKLTCEVVTSIPKVLANTYKEIDVQSASEDIPPDEVKADDANGGTMTTVVFFVVVNFLLLLGIIFAVIGYKYAKNKHPDVLKKFNYKPVSTKGEEAPSEPLATSTKADDAEKQKGKQHPDIKPSTEVHQEKHKVSLSHSDETATMKKADDTDDLKTSVIRIESAPGKTAESLKQPEPSKKPDPVIDKTPSYPQSQQQDTSAAVQMGVGTNQRKINWNPQTQRDPNWQDTPHQPTNKQNPPIKDQAAPSHRPSPEQMQAVQQAKQGQGPDIQRHSEPPMSQTAGAHKDTTTGKSTPQPGEPTHRKSDVQQELESPAQKAVSEAKEKAVALRVAAEDAKQKASDADQDFEKAKKRVKEVPKDQKKAAEKHAEEMKKKKNQAKTVKEEAEKKAKEAEKKAEEAERKAEEAEKKAEKAEKNAEEARKKAEKKTAKKTKGSIKNTKL